jgi:hypothetical protein
MGATTVAVVLDIFAIDSVLVWPLTQIGRSRHAQGCIGGKGKVDHALDHLIAET